MYRYILEIARVRPKSVRNLYTDQIYPYPDRYVSGLYPKFNNYRETWETPYVIEREVKYAYWGFKAFWTYIWYKLLWHPEYVFGHHQPPPGSFYTDEELGIPPDEDGPYADWLAKKYGLD